MWIRGDSWAYHREMFVATLLLVSALGLAINRVWSNLLAAIMSGQLPIAVLAEFWLLAKNAELATFSVQHFTTWLRLMSNADFKPILLINLSMIILSYSVISIMRCRTGGQTFDFRHQ